MTEIDHHSDEKHRRRLAAMLAEKIQTETERVSWPLERLWELRDERLRALIRHAKEFSPWHARRLAHIDPEEISGADMSEIPPMTKTDLMNNWDEIVTDRRLTLSLAYEHLNRMLSEGRPRMLLGRYAVIASGGSTGQRGVIAIEPEAFLDLIAPSLAHSAHRQRSRGHDPRAPQVRASLQASSPGHGTALVNWLMEREGVVTHVLPPTWPLAEIVAKLNELQPTVIAAYPSMLGLLECEAHAGRLRIKPHTIMGGAEPLPEEISDASIMEFGVEVENVYAAIEAGMMARSNPPLAGLHLHEQCGVFEPVDFALQPVPIGERAPSFLYTNVMNRTLPLIRYQMTDQIRLLNELNPGPWPGRRIAEVDGRTDEIFFYDEGVVVHPYVLRAIFGPVQEITEYQVRQTPGGIDVTLCLDGDIEYAIVPERLVKALTRLGLKNPEVIISRAERIDHLQSSGKLKRFVPRER